MVGSYPLLYQDTLAFTYNQTKVLPSVERADNVRTTWGYSMNVPQALGDVKPIESSVVSERAREPVMRCAMEYISAYDRRVVGQPDVRLDTIAQDLIAHGKELLESSSFKQRFLGIAWRMVMLGVVNDVQCPPTPLTQDLVPIPDSKARAKNGWDVKHQRDFSQDPTNRVRDLVLERLGVLERKIVDSSVAALSDQECTSLVQLSEAIVEYKGDSLKRLKGALKEGKSLDGAVHSLDELANRLEPSLQGELETKTASVMSAIVAHRLAELRVAGLIDPPKVLARPVANRLSGRAEPVSGLDATTIVASADELALASEIPCLRRSLEKILPKPIADVVVNLEAAVKHEALVRWATSNRESLEALSVELIRQSLFARPGTPERLLPAVRSGLIGTELARLLESKKRDGVWDPSHRLFVHHAPHRPPRVLESVALTGAHRVTLVGELREHASSAEDDVTRLLRLTLLLSKYDSTVAERASLPSTFGTGAALLEAELAGASLNCEGDFSHARPPREIALLERATQGSVAWIANASGEIVSTIVFDGKRCPSEDTWRSVRIADGWWHAVPIKKIKLSNPPQVGSDATASLGSASKASVPMPKATHLLSEKGRADLVAWFEIADTSSLFGDDPTFNGSSEATSLLSTLRQAAKGQAVNSKALRSLRKLSETLGDSRRRPVLRAPQLHDVRDELGVILRGEFSRES